MLTLLMIIVIAVLLVIILIHDITIKVFILILEDNSIEVTNADVKKYVHKVTQRFFERK